jgi:hypothetical protein
LCLDIKYLIKITSIERSNQKNFFIGVLTLLLDYKINQYEKRINEANETKKIIDEVYLHIDLLKELSTVVYFDYCLLRALYGLTGKEKNNNEVFENLMKAFKYYKIYKNFRKG